ncbi:hypothetical protein HDU96_007583 [Phlyctochytrium bullatum]|nr:hypothetical protein HDU96_007583 [Phlyctochytrium bullatum]
MSTGTASEAARLIESLPLSLQQELLDLLLRRAASTSQVLASHTSTAINPDDPWLKVLRTVDHLHLSPPPSLAIAPTSSASSTLSASSQSKAAKKLAWAPLGGPRGGELVFMRTPEDVAPVIEVLREIQRDAEARALFDGLEVPLDVKDTRSGTGDKVRAYKLSEQDLLANAYPIPQLNTRPTTNVFSLIESHILTLLLLSPSLILRSTRPRASHMYTHSIHLLPGARALSNSSTHSLPSSVGSAPNPTPGPSSVFPPMARLGSLDSSLAVPGSSTSTVSVGSMSSAMSAGPIQPPASGSGSASSTLNRLLSSSTLLTSTVERLVSHHSDRILARLDSPAAVDHLERYGTLAEQLGDAVAEVMRAVRRVREWDAGVGRWDEVGGVYGGVVKSASGFVWALRKYVEFAVGVLGGDLDGVEGEEEGEEGVGGRARTKSMIVLPDSARSSASASGTAASPSRGAIPPSDGGDMPSPGKVMEALTRSIEKSKDGRKKSSLLATKTTPAAAPEPTKKPKKRISMDFRLLYAAAAEGKTAAAAAPAAEVAETAGRKSSETPPVLPEILVGQHYVLDRPEDERSAKAGAEKRLSKRESLNPSILQPPTFQRLRLVSPTESTDDWRVRLAPEDDATSVPSDAEAPPAVDSAKRTSTATAGRKDRWSKMLQDVTHVSHDALPEGKEAAVASTSAAVGEDDDEEDRIPLAEIRKAFIASASPTTPPLPATTDPAAPETEPAELGDNDDADSNAGSDAANDDAAGAAASAKNAGRATFDSLQVVGRKGSQRIPTFDSQGRRIGVLDHGTFSTDTADAGAKQLAADGAASSPAAAAIAVVAASRPASTAVQPYQKPSGSISVRGNLLHLNEDGADVLVMEMVSGRLHIVAGTLEKLLFRLADENIQDNDFVDTFIQCHSFFISSLDFLDNLILRYNVRPPENPTPEELDYFATWRRPIQLKVLTVLSRWVKIQYEDFEIVPLLRERLEIFLSDAWMDGFRSESDRIRRAASIQASSIAMRAMSTPFYGPALYYDEADDEASDPEDVRRSAADSSRKGSQADISTPGSAMPTPPTTAPGTPNNALARVLFHGRRSPSVASKASSASSASSSSPQMLRQRSGGPKQSFFAGPKKKGLEPRGRRTTLLTTSIPFSTAPATSSAKSKPVAAAAAAAAAAGALTKMAGANPLGMVALVSGPQDTTPVVLAFDARDIARYMTTADQNAFANIPVVDYLAKLSGSKVGEGEAHVERKLGARVDLFAERANSIRNWVALEICSTKSPKLRRKVIEKFIQIAKKCKDLRNFHTSLFIASGLLSAAVQRLKKTWEGIPARDLAALRELEALLDPSGNMRALRNAMAGLATLGPASSAASTAPSIASTGTGAQLQGPLVPFFPLVMKDVTFLNDGNPGIRDPPTPGDNAPAPPALINFDKYRNLCTVLQKYTQPAQEPYDFTPILTPVLRGLPALSAAAYAYTAVGMHAARYAAAGAGDPTDGLAAGLATTAAIAALVEGRLRASTGEAAAMQRAWEMTGAVDGEEWS